MSESIQVFEPAPPSDPLLSQADREALGCSGSEPALSGKLPAPTDVKAELEALRSDSVPLRRSAARALARRRQRFPAVVDALRTALCDPDWEVRGCSARSLADLDVRDARDAIRPLLYDQVSWVCWQAAESLARLGDVESSLAILEALGDTDRWVRRLCSLEGLGTLGQMARLLDTGDVGIRMIIERALFAKGVEMDRPLGKGWRWRKYRDPHWTFL